MRILVLTPFLSYPLRHGGRIRSHHLMAALAERHEVINVTGLAPDEDPADIAGLEARGITVRSAPLAPAFGRLGTRQRAAKLACLLRGRSSLVPRFHDAALAREVRRTIAEGVDLCVFEQLWSAAYEKEVSGLPFVLSSQNVESALLERKLGDAPSGPDQWLARAEARALSRFEATVAAEARCVVAVSEEDRERFSKLAPGCRVAVVSNGVDLAARPRLPAPSFRPLRLLYVGGYDYEPNAAAARELAEDVLPAVRAEDPAAELLLVGRDPADALAGVDSLPGVRRLGAVEALLPVLEESSALVVPMRQGGGSRLKIVEAWAVGRPVVSTAVGAEGLGPKEDLPLVLAESADEIVNALRRLRDDPVACGALLDRARRRAEERHGWDRLGSRFRDLVEEAGKEGDQPT